MAGQKSDTIMLEHIELSKAKHTKQVRVKHTKLSVVMIVHMVMDSQLIVRLVVRIAQENMGQKYLIDLKWDKSSLQLNII